MTRSPKTIEEVASSLQQSVINHLKGVYAEHDSASTRQILADYDLKQTLELVCDLLPEGLVPQIREVLALHTLLCEFSIDRYYVQRFSDTHFAVRERQVDRVETGQDDLIICDEFSTGPDANCYTQSMNRIQRKLDVIYGRWAKHAAVKTQEGLT